MMMRGIPSTVSKGNGEGDLAAWWVAAVDPGLWTAATRTKDGAAHNAARRLWLSNVRDARESAQVQIHGGRLQRWETELPAVSFGSGDRVWILYFDMATKHRCVARHL